MAQPLSEYFTLEAGEYLDQMDALLAGSDRPDPVRFFRLARGVRGSAQLAGAAPIAEVKEAALAVQIPLIEEAARRGVQILGFQEVFNGPYFCPSQDPHWYDIAEVVPGPTTDRIAKLAAKHQMACVVPVYEREAAGVRRPPRTAPFTAAAPSTRNQTAPPNAMADPAVLIRPASERASARQRRRLTRLLVGGLPLLLFLLVAIPGPSDPGA